MLEDQLDPALFKASVNIPAAVNHCCGFGAVTVFTHGVKPAAHPERAGERQGSTGHQLCSAPCSPSCQHLPREQLLVAQEPWDPWQDHHHGLWELCRGL